MSEHDCASFRNVVQKYASVMELDNALRYSSRLVWILNFFQAKIVISDRIEDKKRHLLLLFQNHSFGECCEFFKSYIIGDLISVAISIHLAFRSFASMFVLL